MLVVTGDQPAAVRGRGATGLYVPGQGLYVSREEALERLGRLPQQPCGAIGQCEFELFVSVPPLGAQKNDKRYEMTILGDGYRGILVSDRTRIPGLVTISDIRETVEALETGRDPPVEWQASDHPLEELRELDERLSDAQAAQAPATIALTLALIALAALALLTRSALLARGALLYPLAAIALALAASALQLVGPLVTTLIVLAAAPLALVVAARVPLTLAVPVFLAGYGLVLALSPETNSLMAIGPYPWSGSRFYGVNNQIETLLLGPTLAAGVLLRGWRLVALALLSLVVVGASKTGADGGGILVFAAGFAVLGALLQRPTPRDSARVARRRRAGAGVRRPRRARRRVEPRDRRGLRRPRRALRHLPRPSRAFRLDRDLQRVAARDPRGRTRRPRVLRDAQATLPGRRRVPRRDRGLPRRQRLADEGRGVRGDRLLRAARVVGFARARRDRIPDVRKLVLLLAALVLVVAIPACGGEEEEQALPETVEGTLPADTGAATEGDAANGKKVFASAGCGGCHTFAAAGSTGTVGPNLDDASVDVDAAVQQVKNGGGGMPAFGDRLSDQEIADVAAFVTQ